MNFEFRLIAIAASALCAACTPTLAPIETAPAVEVRLPEPAVAMAMPVGGVGPFLTCLRERDATIVSAHRGGPVPGYPENAIETFAWNLARAPMLLEVDVRQTSDGIYVLFHDDDMDEDTAASGPLSARSLAELRALTLRDNDGQDTGAHIPTLEEALDWAEGRAILQLDVKRGVAFEPLIAWLQARDAEDYTLIITYNPEDAARVARASERLMISASIDEAADLAELEALGVPANRIIAWTGLETPRPALWAMLAARGISSNFGTMWDIDEGIAESGNDGLYASFALQGADIVSTDRQQQAFAAIEAGTNSRSAIAACTDANY